MGFNSDISHNVYYVKLSKRLYKLPTHICVTRHISCHLRQMLCHSHEFHGLTLRLNFSLIFHNVLPKAPSNFLALIKYYLDTVLLKKLLNISYL